jgi:hypothetical protein
MMCMTLYRRTSLKLALIGMLAVAICAGGAIAKDITTQGHTSELGSVPEFHPELGLDALQGYLDPKALPDSLKLVPPPPPAGSAAFANDEAVANATFGLRDTPRYALAVSDFDLRLPRLIDDFSCALDGEITQDNAPYLATLLRRSFSDIGLSTYSAKNYYKRKRPFQLNDLPMGVPEYRAQLEKDPSYPSGHTAIGWGFALILSELAPERANELLDRGRAFGESRIVVNHHWFSDVVWGRAIGAATVARLHAEPTFRADMEAARVEIGGVRAKGLNPTHDCKTEAAAMAQGYQANEVTAIDILLEPDALLIQRAEANNARLLKMFPKGYTLDATHRPHITLVQLFVRTADLERVYSAASQVIANANVTAMKLEAFKYYYIPARDIGVAGIVAKPTPDLIKLQTDLLATLQPYIVANGDSTAFVTTPDDPVIDPLLIDYVSSFVAHGAGENFNPHVTTGVALRTDLDEMLTEPFDSFSFSPAGAAVYQLGQFGTAAKKLRELGSK